MLRRTLRGLIILLVGAGLIAVVYATRPDVPVGSATSRAQQLAAPAHSAATAPTRPVPTSPGPNTFVAMAVKPMATDAHEVSIHSKDGKSLGADAPRAELANEPVSRGWGNSYAVRLLTSSGQPMITSQIVLIAHMADGTVQNVAMGALPERGMYRATVPTRHSAPISLQVRVSHGEQWVEIPVGR